MLKMNTTVNGVGTNPGKIMFYMGVLFAGLGVLIGGSMIVGSVAFGELNMIFMGVMFLAIFGGIGGLFAKIGYDNTHANDDVLRKGAAYLGKIYSYEPDYQILMNGQPCITLVVRYLMAGQIREVRVNTGDADASRYPHGATVSIKVHDGVAALVPGSVSDMRIEREDDLMNPDFDPNNIMPSVGVSCPNCGANIVVPIGMSRFCPYCNTKVSVAPDGSIAR